MSFNIHITHQQSPELISKSYRDGIKDRSDRLMNYFLGAYFLTGIFLAQYYDTWMIAVGVGGTLLIAYYSAKWMLPDSCLYQYVLSAVFGIFMAQFIYQMHGLFEMHFLAFIGSALLITYQKWQLQLPALIIVFIHHALFSYLQNVGWDKVYFTQLDFFTLQTFIFHIVFTVILFFISGLWSYQLKKYNEAQISQALQMAAMKKEVQLSLERKENAEMMEKLNLDLERKTRELTDSNADLEQFAYAASHDLQEPLRMITGFLGQIEKHYAPSLDDRGKEYIHYAVDGAQRMRQIILDLLEYSRVGRTRENPTQVDLGQVIEEVRLLHGKQLLEKKVFIRSRPLPVINGFKAPLRQIFQNIIGNAIKYQQPGQICRVWIDCTEKTDLWEFSITDNGIGIAPEYHQQIFSLFKRLHDRETYPGTGMGLAITKKIVENLGGSIWLRSSVGVGSTFYFTIPK
jgi:signal transduction histidine kinase